MESVKLSSCSTICKWQLDNIVMYTKHNHLISMYTFQDNFLHLDKPFHQPPLYCPGLGVLLETFDLIDISSAFIVKLQIVLKNCNKMENLSIPTLRILYKHYVNWVSTHPERTTDLEASIKWISYFLAGRINNSTLLSELIYSMSNFMMLFNDQIILNTVKHSATVNGKGKKDIFCSENIKRFLTMVDYIEVFIEVSATKLWGTRGRWIIVTLLQALKCSARLYLLHVHKMHILESPPIQPLDRKTVGIKQTDIIDNVITLPSGRTIRKLDNAPPMNKRTWEAPPRADKFGRPESNLNDRNIVAETMYIMKPVVHLGSMYAFGDKSWKPWLISLTIEYISLQRLKSSKNLTPQQRLVLSKRALNMAMYLVRSPFFENYSEKHIRAFLYWFVNTMPLVGSLMRPFLEYMQQWQDTYFYLWST